MLVVNRVQEFVWAFGAECEEQIGKEVPIAVSEG